MQDLYHQYINEFEMLRVLVTGSNIPHARLIQSDTIYAINPQDAHHYVEDFYEMLHELCRTALKLMATHAGILHRRMEFLRTALGTARIRNLPYMEKEVLARLADTRRRLAKCASTIRRIKRRAREYAGQAYLREMALQTDKPAGFAKWALRTDETTGLVMCELVIPLRMADFPGFIMDSDAL